jgi:hypothetical protein
MKKKEPKGPNAHKQKQKSIFGSHEKDKKMKNGG